MLFDIFNNIPTFKTHINSNFFEGGREERLHYNGMSESDIFQNQI